MSRGLGSLAGEENASSHWVDDVGSGPCMPHPEQKPSEWAASFFFFLYLLIYFFNGNIAYLEYCVSFRFMAQ